MGKAIVFLSINNVRLVMANPLTYNALRIKAQSICLLAEHGMNPTTTDSDILNN